VAPLQVHDTQIRWVAAQSSAGRKQAVQEIALTVLPEIAKSTLCHPTNGALADLPGLDTNPKEGCPC